MASPGEKRDLERSVQQPQVEERQLAEKTNSPSDTSSQDPDYERDLEKEAEAHEKPQLVRHVTTASSVATKDLVEPTSTPKRSWLNRLNPLRLRKPPPVPEERTVSREYNASFLSLLTFHWIAPLMTTGYLRPLELGDIWLVNPNRSADLLTKRMMASFKKRAARGDQYPLLWALHETFFKEFWLGGFCQLSSSIFQVITPYTTRYLIQYANDAYDAKKYGAPAPHISRGIGLVIGITLMQIFQSMGTSHFIYRGMMVGGETRAVLISAIFEKALKISGRAKAGGKAVGDEKTSNGIDAEYIRVQKEGLLNRIRRKKEDASGPKVTPDRAAGVSGDGTGWSNGRIVTLMSVDTYRVDQASGMFHLLWTSPISIAITLVVLCINLGASALSGYALLMLGIPLLTKAIKSLFKRRRKINKITDQRVSLTQEIMLSVRFVKYFGWESSFLDRLKEIRRREIHAIQILLAIRNAINAVSMALPIFASMLAFITFSQTQHMLTPAPVFSSLALFNSLRMPLNLLPLVIGQVTDAYASLGRIQEFLLGEERLEDTIWDGNMEPAVDVQNASFTWERTADIDKDRIAAFQSKAQLKDSKIKAKQDAKEAKKNADQPASRDGEDAKAESEQEIFELNDLNFTVGRNELLAVIGTVGSGKSSLLAALAGDMRLTDGKMKLGASRAFCPQYAWIQNTTVKENILFGRPYDPVWYNRVIDACALRPDMEIFPAGDRTEIGERGITVSGGVSADSFLLDATWLTYAIAKAATEHK